jgi:hypothetical protein
MVRIFFKFSDFLDFCSSSFVLFCFFPLLRGLLYISYVLGLCPFVLFNEIELLIKRNTGDNGVLVPGYTILLCLLGHIMLRINDM